MAGLVVAAVMIWFAVQTRNHEFHERCLADHDHNITMQEGCPKELNGILRRQIEAARHGVLFRAYSVLVRDDGFIAVVVGFVLGASALVSWEMFRLRLIPHLYLTDLVPVWLTYIIVVVFFPFMFIPASFFTVGIHAVLLCLVYRTVGRIESEEK
jgi:hypothetical protein